MRNALITFITPAFYDNIDSVENVKVFFYIPLMSVCLQLPNVACFLI